jgi:outer membrane protein assembly factor BamA
VEILLGRAFFNDDSEEIETRVRALFQDRGYFKAEVKNVSLKADDPLGSPKPVTMIAEVDEGELYKLNQITFLENHAFSAKTLGNAFPMKKGDVFARSKVASGLGSVKKLYEKGGYLDGYFVPNTQIAAGVDLIVTMNEGPRYHMGKLEILADKTLADQLQLTWKLREGAVYDATYIEKFIEENHDLLPSGFGREQIKLAKNCPEAVVDVRLTIEDKDAKSRAPMKDVPCKKKEESAK